MTAYASGKTSGIQWLGKIPIHWRITRLRALVDISTGAKDTIDQKIDGKYPFFVRSQAVKRINSWSFDGEAVLTAGDGDIGKIFHYANGKFDYHQRVYMFCQFREVKAKYFYYFILSNLHNEVLSLTAKSTVDSIRLPMLLNFPVLIPTWEEQYAIIEFLDHADLMMRGGVSQKRRLVELMEEYKRAVIQQAVTRGLDPDVPLKPSGVEWLGDIPEHWELRRLKTVAELVMGQSPPGDDCSNTPVGLPFLQGCAEFGDSHPNPEQFCLVPPRVALAGSILMSVRAPVGRLNVADQDYGIGRGLCGIIPNGVTLLDDFAYYQLLVMEDALRLVSTGSTYEAVSTGDVGGQVVVTPPLTEQTAIVAHLDKLTSDIDAAIAHTRREIELLEEYRTRLIADVVTGKLDVREAVSNLPDVDLDDIQPQAEGGEADD